MSKAKNRPAKSYEGDIIKLVLLAIMAPVIFLLLFMAFSGISIYLKIIIITFTIAITAYCCFAIWKKVSYQLRSSLNIIEAIVLGDTTLRLTTKYKTGALAEFNHVLNGLSKSISQHKQKLKEQQLLLTKVINQIDVAIIATDHNNAIVLMNPSAERLFSCRYESVEGGPINQLGLQQALTIEDHKVVEFQLEQHRKKVYLHVDQYIVDGLAHNLIFITDIQQLLREEERIAWQRLVRVLSHEINNSLTPIASISDSLCKLINQDLTQKEHQDDLHEGLAVISERAQSLNIFIKSYHQLSTLPPPTKSLITVATLIHSTTALYPSVNWHTEGSSTVVLYVDNQQLQQALVNIITNAIEASKTPHNENKVVDLTLLWQVTNNNIAIELLDSGVGIANTDNLFVPFYTTKIQGSGIGLVLSRQIIMNHDGDMQIENRANQRGAKVTIILPLTK